MSETKKIEWLNLANCGKTLDDLATKVFEADKALSAAKKAHQEAVNALMSKKNVAIPEGHIVIFSYRFGKASVAIVPDERKPRSAKDKKVLDLTAGGVRFGALEKAS